MKKKILFSLLVALPLIVFSQFGDNEMYGYSRIGAGFSMRDIYYTSVLEGEAIENPVSAPLKLGSGVSPEIGVGLMVLRRFFVEGNFAYVSLNKNVKQSEQAINYISGYHFNRTSVGVNGVYLIEVDPSFVLDFNAGIDAVFPHDLVVYTSQGEERIKYQATAEVHAGFGGNFVYHNFVFGMGLRYRYEAYKTSANQNFPLNFYLYNKDFRHMEVKGIDIVFTVKYLF